MSVFFCFPSVNFYYALYTHTHTHTHTHMHSQTHQHRASQVALLTKNPPASAGDVRDVSSVPELGRSPGGRNGNPLQYFCLENLMDRRAWLVTVYRVTEKTQLK